MTKLSTQVQKNELCLHYSQHLLLMYLVHYFHCINYAPLIQCILIFPRTLFAGTWNWHYSFKTRDHSAHTTQPSGKITVLYTLCSELQKTKMITVSELNNNKEFCNLFYSRLHHKPHFCLFVLFSDTYIFKHSLMLYYIQLQWLGSWFWLQVMFMFYLYF
jgi:hypothetical protein